MKPRPWKLAVLSLGDGTGNLIITDANDNPVLFVVNEDKKVGELVVEAVNTKEEE